MIYDVRGPNSVSTLLLTTRHVSRHSSATQDTFNLAAHPDLIET